jgi:hypothetical protein
MLIHIIRNGKLYDYVKDYMLDNMIKSKEIVQFKRSKGWVTIGVDPIRESKRDTGSNGNGIDRIPVNNSTLKGDRT